MRYFSPDESYLPQIKSLCCTCFDMSAVDVEFIFNNNYITTDMCYAVADGNNICCLLFAVPCSMMVKGKEYKGRYIYGACTSPRYRNRGLMHRLMNFANIQTCKDGDAFSVVLPKSKSLYNFYSDMGYSALYKAKNQFVPKEYLPDSEKEIAYSTNPGAVALTKIRNRICGKHGGSICYDHKVMNYAVKRAGRNGGGVFQCDYGYFIYDYNKNKEMVVQELMCERQHLRYMLSSIKKLCNSEKLMLRVPPWLCSESEKFGMIKVFYGRVNTDEFNSAYMGLTFD